MSKNPERDQIMRFLADAQPKLAALAKKWYAECGRGIVRLEFPDLSHLPPSTTVQVMIREAEYHTLDEMRKLMAGLQDDEDSAVTLRMIETYDPDRQAVVVATVGQGLPVTVKLKLDVPTVVDDPGGVH